MYMLVALAASYFALTYVMGSIMALCGKPSSSWPFWDKTLGVVLRVLFRLAGLTLYVWFLSASGTTTARFMIILTGIDFVIVFSLHVIAATTKNLPLLIIGRTF